jgi:aspartyl-tRNA(Asn)/glutamyl-tRNA(Gln) amidotransferase subunit C
MDVKKVAQLSQLAITDQEAKLFEEQMTAILQYFNELEAVDTEGVMPLVTPTDMVPVWREDQAKLWPDRDLALDQAPERMGHLFKVPPVV